MAATAVDTTLSYRSRRAWRRAMLRRLVPAALLLPSLLFLAVFFALFNYLPLSETFIVVSR